METGEQVAMREMKAAEARQGTFKFFKKVLDRTAAAPISLFAKAITAPQAWAQRKREKGESKERDREVQQDSAAFGELRPEPGTRKRSTGQDVRAEQTGREFVDGKRNPKLNNDPTRQPPRARFVVDNAGHPVVDADRFAPGAGPSAKAEPGKGPSRSDMPGKGQSVKGEKVRTADGKFVNPGTEIADIDKARRAAGAEIGAERQRVLNEEAFGRSRQFGATNAERAAFNAEVTDGKRNVGATASQLNGTINAVSNNLGTPSGSQQRQGFKPATQLLGLVKGVGNKQLDVAVDRQEADSLRELSQVLNDGVKREEFKGKVAELVASGEISSKDVMNLGSAIGREGDIAGLEMSTHEMAHDIRSAAIDARAVEPAAAISQGPSLEIDRGLSMGPRDA